MLPLTGYTDRLSARPGEALSFKISSSGPDPFEARLVRVVSADPNPAGPGLIEHDLSDLYRASHASVAQKATPGSYAVIDAAAAPRPAALTIEALIWPTKPADGADQIVFSAFDPSLGRGCALGLDGAGRPLVLVGDADGGQTRLIAEAPLAPRIWHRLRASIDAATGRVAIAAETAAPVLGAPWRRSAEQRIAPFSLALAGQWRMASLGAGADGAPLSLYSGKIEAPRIYGGALAADHLFDDALTLPPLAAWDFTREISSLTIRDDGPSALDGRLVNHPARAMTGHNWTGREHCWRHAPEQYGAIHFHDDDLTDCGWETSFTFQIPADLKSGVYAMRLSCGAHEDSIPFFVPAPKGKPGADLCVLISTFTFVVYTNFDRPDFGPAYRERAAALGMRAEFPADHPDYGRSTYNHHSDGSGIRHSSPLRPMLTMRPGYLSYLDGRGSGLRHYPADMHLLAWLDAKGIDADIITDHELDEEGVEALAGYRALLTGSHPEYHTEASHDAVTAFRDQGGRFCYLGGNGFYWRVARHPETPEVIEIRRGEGGIRAWASEPGEYFNAFDGAYGGLWRRQGRPPQMVGGVGFSAQGPLDGSHFRLTAAATDPRAAWIFEGVAGPTIGGHGFSGGGAAGFELDRADTRLGTPSHALVLAQSEGHSDQFILVHEEQLTHLVTLPGEPAAELIRADIVFYETPAGGAVFSTGSITFCGSLPSDGFANDVSTMLENVVRRFLDPAPFAPPSA